jgi:uncharacterized protein
LHREFAMEPNCTAFEGTRCVASGTLAEVVKKIKENLDETEQASVLIFDNSTSEPVEVDLRGSLEDVLLKLERQEPEVLPDTKDERHRAPGRPKLGVISREVSLLPRHWDWLNAQPGGASVALRKLVEEGRRVTQDRDRVRRSQEVAYRFMSAMAGNLPGFEEAIRALFAGNAEKFDIHTDEWPVDIRNYARQLSGAAFPKQEQKS